MRIRAVLATAACLLSTGVPVARADGPVVLPGYDLFTTLPGTQLEVRVDGPAGQLRNQLVSFGSAPLGQFDFGAGLQQTGGADTIVRRLGTATPEQGRVDVELVALQLRSLEPAGYFAT